MGAALDRSARRLSPDLRTRFGRIVFVFVAGSPKSRRPAVGDHRNLNALATIAGYPDEFAHSKVKAAQLGWLQREAAGEVSRGASNIRGEIGTY